MVSHRVELAAPKLFGEKRIGPVLIERTERQFMQTVLADLSDPARHSALRNTQVAERKGGGYHLYQPVHRVFHLAVLGVVCTDMPTKPRLDPLRIESAGLVVRKVRNGRGQSLGELGWLVANDGSAGWAPPERAASAAVNDPGAGSAFADPNPARRSARSTGHAILDGRIAALKQYSAARTESVSPIFPLSPTACEACGETLVVGLIPTASRETERARERELPDVTELEAAGFFPTWLSAGASGRTVPFAQELLSFQSVNQGASPKRLDLDFAEYSDFVIDMLVAFDMNGSGPASQRLREALRQVQLPFTHPGATSPTYVSAYDHLLQAAAVIIDGDESKSFRMPDRWGTVSAAIEASAKDAMLGATQARYGEIAVDRGRFEERDASYVVRGFVRVKREDGCPAQLWWSAPSAEFKIAPWYDSSPGPRTLIELPNPLRDGLASIKPNVAFAVPPVLANALGRNSPEDLLKGEGSAASDTGLAWICSFSIPIITICAFIMLNLFISLLNLVFWWLPFVKICIPVPKPK